MSFNHSANALCLHRLGAWTTLTEEVQTGSSGWDTKNVTFARYAGVGATSASITAQFPLGKHLGGSYWLTEVTPRAIGGGIWTAQCVGKGLSGTRPPRRSGGAASLQRSIENLDAFGFIFPKAEVWESTPTLEIEYISTSRPPTDDVGKSQVPPSPPAVRTSAFSQISDPTWHFPNGWVIADVRYEQLLDLSVYLVTEVYEYRYQFTP